jgi:hypothetical protein
MRYILLSMAVGAGAGTAARVQSSAVPAVGRGIISTWLIAAASREPGSPFQGYDMMKARAWA